MQGSFIMHVSGAKFLLLTWFSHWLERLSRPLGVNLKLHLWATPVFPQTPRLLCISDGVNVACYCMSSIQDFKQLPRQISSEDCVNLWPSVLKQQLGKEKWKLDLFINLTSISPVSGLLHFSGICIIYRILFIWSPLSATSAMQMLQTIITIWNTCAAGRLSHNTAWSRSWSQFDLIKSDISVFSYKMLVCVFPSGVHFLNWLWNSSVVLKPSDKALFQMNHRALKNSSGKNHIFDQNNKHLTGNLCPRWPPLMYYIEFTARMLT